MAEISGLGELIATGVTVIGVENDGVGFGGVGGPGVGGLLDKNEAVDRDCLLASVEDYLKSLVSS